MVQLLHKYHITAADSSVKLIKVIKNPVSDHLPPGQSQLLSDLVCDEPKANRKA